MAKSKTLAKKLPQLTGSKLVNLAGQAVFDRAEQYVCSDALAQRLVGSNNLSARIYGNYGIYEVGLEFGPKDQLASYCTCPAEMYCCKHAVALGLTWMQEPESFFNIESLRVDLETRSKDELVELVIQMAKEQPAVLTVLGIEGFDEEEPDEPEGYEEY
jgi:uncharacterized Zn finger protein